MNNEPKKRQEWMLELLKKEPLMSSGGMFKIYSEKFTFSRRTFQKDWKAVEQKHLDYQKKAQKEKERASIEAETEAVKRGLKTKIERVLILQEQVDTIIKELEKGTHTEKKIFFDEEREVVRLLTPFEKATMRKNIKDLQSEISKIEGDYSVIKQDITTNGKEINDIGEIKINIIPPPDDE